MVVYRLKMEPGKTYRIKFEWGERSKIYLDHVYNLFDEWVLSEPHKKTRISPKGNSRALVSACSLFIYASPLRSKFVPI
jgi:hypothetical protein